MKISQEENWDLINWPQIIRFQQYHQLISLSYTSACCALFETSIYSSNHWGENRKSPNGWAWIWSSNLWLASSNTWAQWATPEAGKELVDVVIVVHMTEEKTLKKLSNQVLNPQPESAENQQLSASSLSHLEDGWADVSYCFSLQYGGKEHYDYQTSSKSNHRFEPSTINHQPSAASLTELHLKCTIVLVQSLSVYQGAVTDLPELHLRLWVCWLDVVFIILMTEVKTEKTPQLGLILPRLTHTHRSHNTPLSCLFCWAIPVCLSLLKI